MCWARSFFSRTIDAQLATGATHDIRIFTGSAARVAVKPKRPKAHAPASADLRKRTVSFPPSFAGLAHEMASFSSRAKIVKGPTDFGKRVENGPIAVRLWLKARADARLLLGQSGHRAFLSLNALVSLRGYLSLRARVG